VLDVLLLQEPYIFFHPAENIWKIPAFGLPARICPTSAREKFLACIVLLNKNYDFQILSECITARFAVAEVKASRESIILISGYIPPSEDIDISLAELNGLLKKFRNLKVIMALDANSKNDIWYSKETSDIQASEGKRR
jgi:hypothetical protein